MAKKVEPKIEVKVEQKEIIKVITFTDLVGKYAGKDNLVSLCFKDVYANNNVITYLERKGEIYFICKI